MAPESGASSAGQPLFPRELPVFTGEEDRNEVRGVVGVNMGVEKEINIPVGNPRLQHVSHGARPAIDYRPLVLGEEKETRGGPPQGGNSGPRAENNQFRQGYASGRKMTSTLI